MSPHWINDAQEEGNLKLSNTNAGFWDDHHHHHHALLSAIFSTFVMFRTLEFAMTDYGKLGLQTPLRST